MSSISMMPRLFLLFLFFIGAAHAATVRGVITGPDDTPVNGAVIWAAATGRYEYSEKDGTLRRLASDGNGAFSFEIPDTARFGLVRVQAPGFAVQDDVLRPGDNVLHLQAAKGTRGVVQDKKGVPVVNTRVRLTSTFGWNYFQEDLLSDTSDFLSSLAFIAALPRIETRSDDKGQWALAEVNEGYVFLDDERFAWAVSRAAGQAKSLTLRAEPSASLRGQILTTEGKPLAGVFVDGTGLFALPPRTDADGRFLLTNLKTEDYNLNAIAPDSDWLIPWLKVTPLKAGEVNQAPQWTATRGVEVTGQMVDKTDGKPLPGIEIPAGGRQHVVTDIEGHFRVRVIAGQAYVSLNHPRFMAVQKELEIPPGAGTFDAGKFELQRAAVITGRVVDEKGDPLSNVALAALYDSGRGPTNAVAYSDTNGHFKTKVPLGPLTLRVYPNTFRTGFDERELTPEKEVKVTATDNTPSLRLTAKLLPVILVGGRIVSSQGQPIEAADVSIQAETPSADGQGATEDYKSAKTDVEGRFSVGFVPGFKTLKVYSVRKDGHRLKTSGAATRKKDGWDFSDTVLAALNAQIGGRVIGENGAALAGALVQCVENSKFEPLTTGADGRFQFTDLPEGDLTVLAAHGRNFGSVTAKPGADIEIKILPPSLMIKPMKQQFFEQLVRSEFYHLTNHWSAIGTERMLALALQKDGALPPGNFDTAQANWAKSGEATLWLLLYANGHDADWQMKNAWQILGRVPRAPTSDYRFALEKKLAIVAGWRGDQTQRAWAEKWLDEAIKQKDKPNAPKDNAERWFNLAGVAGALGRADAKQMALTALQFAAQTDPKELDSNAYGWGGALSYGGPEVFALLENEWPVSARLNALFGAVSQLSGLDLERGKVFLEKEHALAAQNPKKAPDAEEWPQSRTTEWYWRTAQASHDPLAALDWLEKSAPGDWPLRGAIARELLKRGDREIVSRALRPILDPQLAQSKKRLSPNRSESKNFLSYYGALVKPFDAALAAQLFEKSREAISLPEFSSNRADYDYYWTFQDPARTRLWLEYAWASAKQPGPKDWRREQNSYLAGAMVALDEVRAMEILGSAAGSDSDKSQQSAFIAAFLLADEAVRPTLRAGGDF